MSTSAFHVAILGGGIGGLTAALSLAHHCPGINISVFEQAPTYSEIGAGVGIGVNAGKILHKLAVGDAANAVSGERNGIHRSHRRWDNGEEIVTVEAMDDGSKVRQLSVHRAELLQVLLDAIMERGIANLYTNKKGVKVTEAPNNLLTLSFSDSTSHPHPFNLIVGADGIHSQLRSLLDTRGIQDHPRYSGRIAYRGLLPLPSTKSFWPFRSYAISWLAPGKHFLVFPISQNRTLNVVAFVTRPLEELNDLRESWTSYALREELAAEYEGWDPTVGKIIAAMEPMVGKWRLNDRELLPQWSFLDGRVVLLGDAAHAMLPHQGSGAGHAIEDAYILGLSLRDYFLSSLQDLSTWTSVYQRVRLPRAQKAQITSRQAGDVYEMAGPEFAGLTFDECCPIVKKKLEGRMKWVWSADVNADYETVAKGVREEAARKERDVNGINGLNGVNGAPAVMANGEEGH